MLSDYHVHTAYSDDSDYPMEQVIQDAIRLGLDELCITDHVDYGVKADWDAPEAERLALPVRNVNYPEWYAELCWLRERYAGQITLRTGMEFGVQTHTIPRYRALFQRYPFDFILLSCHQVEDKEFWNQDFQRGRSQAEYNRRYYEELLKVMRQYEDYSVLAHLDLIRRYDEAGDYPFARVRDLVEEVLKTAISKGKGIELNTSCFRYGLADLTPSREILSMYHSLGGEILTIGSDSHAPGQLGEQVGEVQGLLRELGFRYCCTYEVMKPIFHPLQ